MKDKRVIFSLGGSLIVPPSGIDTRFIKQFREFVELQVKGGYHFAIVCGGGSICRSYQQAAREILNDDINPVALDWIGIYTIRLNAELIHAVFSDIAYPKVVVDLDAATPGVEGRPVLVCGAEEPGHSSDYDAVRLAEIYGIKTIINLSNTDRMYTADPKLNPAAEPLDSLTWDKLVEIIGTEWRPGMSAPFDPVAAQLAKKLDLTVITCDGRDLKNLGAILDDQPFIGTTIQG